MASRKKHRRHIGFNLAFLDVMSCGFGAAVLLFLIIKHGVEQNPNTETESARLQTDITERQTSIENIEQQIAALTSEVRDQEETLSSLDAAIAAQASNVSTTRQSATSLSGEIEKAKKALAALETTVDEREKEAAVEVTGAATQQFLTGLSVEGRRIVIMVDHSASMLDEKLINIIRRRAIGGEMAEEAPKWVRTQRIARWLVNKLPKDSLVRFISFSEAAQILPQEGWLRSSDIPAVTAALEATIDMTPNGGTSLYQAFSSLRSLSPAADAVYVVTDGLPTIGRSRPRKATVDGKERIALFNQAVREIRTLSAKMNVILLPLEGDPDAAFAFWQLSRVTGGRMLSPSEKWP